MLVPKLSSLICVKAVGRLVLTVGCLDAVNAAVLATVGGKARGAVEVLLLRPLLPVLEG